MAAALGALVLLALGVGSVFAANNQHGSIDVSGPSNLDENGDLIERKIDLISPVQRIERSDDFAIGDDGVTTGTLDAVLDENRVVRVVAGTPGSITCESLGDENGCVVLADLLGEAVVWFAVLPRGPRDTVELPPIIDLQDGYALFGNGWQVRYETVIDRERGCPGKDIPSFSDFLRRFGPDSITQVDLETQKVAAVVCGEEYVAPTTTAVYNGSLDGGIVVVGGDAITTTSLATVDTGISAPEN